MIALPAELTPNANMGVEVCFITQALQLNVNANIYILDIMLQLPLLCTGSIKGIWLHCYPCLRESLKLLQEQQKSKPSQVERVWINMRFGKMQLFSRGNVRWLPWDWYVWFTAWPLWTEIIRYKTWGGLQCFKHWCELSLCVSFWFLVCITLCSHVSVCVLHNNWWGPWGCVGILSMFGWLQWSTFFFFPVL